MFEKMDYTFACEKAIYGDMITWLASYGIPYEGSLEYTLPGVTFRMITVKLKTGGRLIMRDIDQELTNLRNNKRWEEKHKG